MQQTIFTCESCIFFIHVMGYLPHVIQKLSRDILTFTHRVIFSDSFVILPNTVTYDQHGP